MCLAQGPQHSDAHEARNRGLSVLSQALYKCAPFLTLGVGLVAPGYPGVKKIIFQHGHVAYQIYGDNVKNRNQVIFSHYGQSGVNGVRSKGQVLLNFNHKIFIPNLSVFSQKRYKAYRPDYSLCGLRHAQVV